MTQLANVITLKTKFPEIGDGATVFGYTDRFAATVVQVSSNGRYAWISYDIAKRTDNNGMSECQSYAYERGNGFPVRVSLRKDGQWRLQGKYGSKVVFGIRDAYNDFSF